ncbi:hypothetical protein TNCT_573701 [Trichonephila clavata]|uniref:Uncharacterized protein n=1 Tax=Trichonephila clavata TaxID=2740835 RepID=A0A8X6HKT4_TRICU|nr:hypothetical protein TNCT_573701 [Trichonephila clavata]
MSQSWKVLFSWSHKYQTPLMSPLWSLDKQSFGLNFPQKKLHTTVSIMSLRRMSGRDKGYQPTCYLEGQHVKGLIVNHDRMKVFAAEPEQKLKRSISHMVYVG